MALKKLQLRPGVNKENTRYANENGWFDSDKVRFRQGTPEKIGGWSRISNNTFLGVCRSLWNWVTLSFDNLVGLGTNLKFYIAKGGLYYDVTPLRTTSTLTTNYFTTNTTTNSGGITVVTVNHTSHGAINGDFVTISYAASAPTVGGVTVAAGEYQITYVNVNSYRINVAGTASSNATGPVSATTAYFAYQVSVGYEIQVPFNGWGAGAWSEGTWGVGGSSAASLRLWTQNNYGEDLIFGISGGGIYYWDATSGTGVRGVLLSSLGGSATFTNASPTVVTLSTAFTAGTPVRFAASTGGALPTGISASTTYYLENIVGLSANLALTAGSSAYVNTSSTGSGVYISQLMDVPTVNNIIFVSDNRFVFAFGCNDYGSAVQNPMLIRWSDYQDPYNWTPAQDSQANYMVLSHGSEIVSAVQTRQEIVVFTDSALYSLQYLSPPAVWGQQLLGDNISIVSTNAAIVASGKLYWMGVDKFYVYDGRVNTLNCDLRKYIYQDINLEQSDQIFCGTNEGFNEVWWFYCSITGPSGTGTTNNPNTIIDRYVIYNYVEADGKGGQGVWYHGSLARTAWLDSGLRDYPMAATYSYNLVNHEFGVDDNTNGNSSPIPAYIASSEFDIDDGDKFGFVYRMLPDMTFTGSTSANPAAVMTLIPMQNSGSGYNNPTSVGGSDNATVTRTAEVPIEQFTGQVYIRVRGRQMIMKVSSTQAGVQWQLGSPRIDIRQDGRR
jgi:hypothetical protein